MLFLLEVKKFDQFNKVMAHAKRVMDKVELDTITKLYEEFRSAVENTEGKILPEDTKIDTPKSISDGTTAGL